MMNKCAVTEEVITTKQRQPNNVDFLLQKLNTGASSWIKSFADLQVEKLYYKQA